MTKETPAQQNTVARVMAEFESGDLKSGPDGKAGKVRSRKQAVAIALSEAGVARPSETDGRTKADLYEEARRKDVAGRSKMTKDELARAEGLKRPLARRQPTTSIVTSS